jgi:hypothetical protein
VSYADQLPIIAAQHREEMRAIERERARNAYKMHNTMCEEARHAMWLEFANRVRIGNVVSPQR